MSTETFYLLVCLECGDPDRPLPIPFGSPAERGRWASEHTRATGHDRWIVKDERRVEPPVIDMGYMSLPADVQAAIEAGTQLGEETGDAGT